MHIEYLKLQDRRSGVTGCMLLSTYGYRMEGVKYLAACILSTVEVIIPEENKESTKFRW
jgi:hypothetical protein